MLHHKVYIFIDTYHSQGWWQVEKVYQRVFPRLFLWWHSRKSCGEVWRWKGSRCNLQDNIVSIPRPRKWAAYRPKHKVSMCGTSSVRSWNLTKWNNIVAWVNDKDVSLTGGTNYINHFGCFELFGLWILQNEKCLKIILKGRGCVLPLLG